MRSVLSVGKSFTSETAQMRSPGCHCYVSPKPYSVERKGQWEVNRRQEERKTRSSVLSTSYFIFIYMLYMHIPFKICRAVVFPFFAHLMETFSGLFSLTYTLRFSADKKTIKHYLCIDNIKTEAPIIAG